MRLLWKWVLSFLLAATLSGCGGSGSASSSVGQPSTASSGSVPTVGTISLNIQYAPVTPARDLPGGTTAVKIYVLNPSTGAPLIAPLSRVRPAGATTQTVNIPGLPPGSVQVLVQALDGSGASVGFSVTALSVVAGETSSASVTTSAALTSIAITPGASSLAVGTSQFLTATGTLSDSSVVNLSQLARWASSASGIATVSNVGRATAIASGSATLTATFGGVSGTATLTVKSSSVTLTSLSVTPSAASIAKGTSKQFVATGTFSDLSTQNLTSTVTWTTGSNAVTISNQAGSNGLATGLAVASNVSITASLDGVQQSTTLTVTAAVVTTLTVLPERSMTAPGGSRQFRASATLSDGTVQDVTDSVTWTITNGTATINTQGIASLPLSAIINSNATVQAATSGFSATATLNAGLFYYGSDVADGQVLFASVSQSDSLLSNLGAVTAAIGGQIVMSPTGYALYSPVSHAVATLPVTVTGQNLVTVGSPPDLSDVPVSGSGLGILPDGSSLVLTDQATLTVRAINVDPTTLLPVAQVGSAVTLPSFQMATPVIDPLERFVYVPEATELTRIATIDVASVGNLNGLGQITTSTFAAQGAPTGGVASPDGKYVYFSVGETGGSFNEVVAFNVGSDGTLTLLGAGTGNATATVGQAITMDPLGRFVYVAVESYIDSYTVQSDGSLVWSSQVRLSVSGQTAVSLSVDSGTQVMEAFYTNGEVNTLVIPDDFFPNNYSFIQFGATGGNSAVMSP